MEQNTAASQILEALSPFDFDPRTRVVFGTGTIARLGELARELGGRRVFLVTDKGLAQAGHEQRGVGVLEAAGLEVVVYDDVHTDPTTEDVDRALAAARDSQIDLIVGLGGGSSIDCAKGVNFLLSNGGRMQDYKGIGRAKKPMLPMIAVPTTAGTGSEAQSFALIADATTHMKMACGDKKAACKVAILDPDLTASMPASVAAATGIDAVSHALETYVTRKRNAVSQLFSRKAWLLLANGFPPAIQDRQNAPARSAMLLGAHLAGAAIEQSMLGATHALANPLSAHYGLRHGIAIGIMLPHVIRYNGEVCNDAYSRLAADIGLCEENDSNAANLLGEHVEWLLNLAGSPTTLAACNVDDRLLDQLAREAAEQWTAGFNPRPVDADSLKELYQCAL